MEEKEMQVQKDELIIREQEEALKERRVMTLLSVISTVGEKFIADKELKDRVVNKATSLLEKELSTY